MDDLRIALGDVLDRAQDLGAACSRDGGVAPPNEVAALRLEAYVEAAALALVIQKASIEPPTTQAARNARAALLVTARMDAEDPARFGTLYGVDPRLGFVDGNAVTDLAKAALSRRGRL